MAFKRVIDDKEKTMTIELNSGIMLGPIRYDELTDTLTRILGDLDNRVSRLEARAKAA